jgi:hypothetical protein
MIACTTSSFAACLNSTYHVDPILREHVGYIIILKIYPAEEGFGER